MICNLLFQVKNSIKIRSLPILLCSVWLYGLYKLSVVGVFYRFYFNEEGVYGHFVLYFFDSIMGTRQGVVLFFCSEMELPVFCVICRMVDELDVG